MRTIASAHDHALNPCTTSAAPHPSIDLLSRCHILAKCISTSPPSREAWKYWHDVLRDGPSHSLSLSGQMFKATVGMHFDAATSKTGGCFGEISWHHIAKHGKSLTEEW
ncbi:hypothetical protein ATANTOWER_021332 [Ataeniobius toweri]|uniref:Uncharacterized protein n=1 Tax=Ataeniobius toweri TaxID=208326 RepID=A0ABU7A292_9TELE|nr:hypothetical protein [Ataeniobius toweri]